MIKNIILDIGGVIADDSLKKFKSEDYQDEMKLPEEEVRKVLRIAFDRGFARCMEGKERLESHIKKSIKKGPLYQKQIEYLLKPDFYDETFPIIKDNLNYVYQLRSKGYKIYFLSNLTYEGHEYLKSTLEDFDGGIYSYSVKCKKPNKKIYYKLLDRYKLKKEECIFFDDKAQNVLKANEIGIKSFLFENIDSIRLALNEN